MPASDLRTRLQRLRQVKRKLPPSVTPVPPLPRAPALDSGLPGKEIITRLGAFQLIETAYPLDYQHGPLRFGDLFNHDSATAALLARDDSLAHADLRSLAFFDTETTGLGSAAGTFIFLCGLGVFKDDQFILRQYFMRDPSEEEALLNHLIADVADCSGWVTFNGRSFDLPLLQTRLTMIGQRGVLSQRPHFDLLHPSRRLYARRFPSCKLGEIEHSAFKIIREQDDVTGGMIPQMYIDYLRTREPDNMRRIIYHNAIDILSMVTLATHLLDVFSTNVNLPTAGRQRLAPDDYLRLAHWHTDAGRLAEAEIAYRAALAGKLDLPARAEALTRFANLLKRQERRSEAAPLWEQLAAFTLDDPEPFIELSKFYEWHETNILSASHWAKRALAIVTQWPKGWKKTEMTEALCNRLERLKRKQDKAQGIRHKEQGSRNKTQ